MSGKYTIPGYFSNAEIKDNEIKEPGFFGKTLFVIKGNEIKEPGFFGKTVLIIEKGRIKKPGFLGEILFYLDKNGIVKEKGLFGKNVGAFPILNGMEPEEYSHENKKKTVSNRSDEKTSASITAKSNSIEKEISLEEYATLYENKQGYVADVTNVKNGVKSISVPKKYKKLTAVAPALSIETINIHEEVFSILTQNIRCSKKFIVNENNPVFCSENGVLYTKDKTQLLRVPSSLDMCSYVIPRSVSVIGKNAFYGVSIENIEISKSVKKICSSAFGFCKGFKSILIPKSVEIIEKDAFIYDKKLIIYTEWKELPKGWNINIEEIKDIKLGVFKGL